MCLTTRGHHKQEHTDVLAEMVNLTAKIVEDTEEIKSILTPCYFNDY